MANWVTVAIDTTATISGTWTPAAAGTYYVYGVVNDEDPDFGRYITVTVQ